MKAIPTLIPILILAPNLVHLQPRIKDITNPLLPVHFGDAYISLENFHYFYYINITNIVTQILDFQSVIRNYSVQLNNNNSPIIHSKLKTLFRLSQNLLATISPRQRRGLFNFIGEASNYLFGTLDNTDKQEIVQYIQQLQLNEKNIQNSFVTDKILLENITRTYDSKINSIVRNQATLLQHIKSISDLKEDSVLLKLLHLQNEFTEIENFIERLITAIDFAKMHVLHPTILNIATQQDLLKNISSTLSLSSFEIYQLINCNVDR